MKFKGVELCCPHCRGDLHETGGREPVLHCHDCDRRYPVILGIPDLRVFPDPYIDFEPDRAKGRRIAEQLDQVDFAGLIDFYYSVTDVVPPQQARLFKRGLLAAAGRSELALDAWEARVSGRGQTLLDLGCGTAPLLVAAAGRFEQMVGVDIAFRWLVMARKRLLEADLDVPLICACAEALPFPDAHFDRVTAESVIETVSDQRQTAREVQRVLQPGGAFFLSTPNKYSLGPDPHVGLPAGGWLPDSWIAAYVRRQGGIPPQRNLLWAGSLRRLLTAVGFRPPQIFLPDIAAAQRAQVQGVLGLAVDVYQSAKQLPGTRQLLRFIGPLLYAVTLKAGT